jgi:hypothetical protein
MSLLAPDVPRLFTAGSFYDCGRGITGTVTRLPEAALRLPSGQVAACDPFIGLGEEADPFADRVAPGTYPVVVSVVEVAHSDNPEFTHERVAAAWLQVADVPTVAWTPALSGDQDLGTLGDTEFFGYGVDAGTGCFIDATATVRLGHLLGEDGNDLIDALYGAETAPDCGPVALADPGTGINLVAFPSGWGDGAYPTWVGRDADGDVTGFLTEFFVVPQPGRDETDV